MTDLPHSLSRSLVIHAPRALVFRYFTDSARFARWWGAGSTIDGRVQGEVKIVYPNKVVARGLVTRLEPDRLVAFTYGYEDPQKAVRVGGSLVTIELADHADGTLLQLRHDLPTAAQRDHHAPGWRFQLALFANVVADERNGKLADVVDAWFRAWSEPDTAVRARLLADCAAHDVAMHDKWCCLTGHDDLLQHITICLQVAPGVTMQRAGEPRHCQGTALVDWTATDAKGGPRGKGTNVVRLDAHGRIASVVGFW
ncbi:MAG: SRPBCC domain-containing protein [Planctomycetes bacterium]|nr:SRPBCC domain-containing protein [Planctomycetota bacterium]